MYSLEHPKQGIRGAGGRNRSRAIRHALSGFGLLGALIGGALSWHPRPVQGAMVGDVALDPRADLQRRLAARAASFAEELVTVYAGPYVVRRTRSELGASLEPGDAYAAVERTERSPFLSRMLNALKGEPVAPKIPWPTRVSRHRAASALAEIVAQVERAPSPGTYLRDGQLVAGIPGQTVNTVIAFEQLERALRSASSSVALSVTTIQPAGPRSYAAAQGAQPSELLYAAETLYPADQSGRSHNIERCVAAINGTVIEPSEEFSFNARVGERSFERGFRAAKELANRRVVTGVGGGVCQVAATLHAAAFLSGMQITTYQPHSRPVSYIPLGLDTMVSWPGKDLRFQNPYPFPVSIRAQATDRLVRIELRGAGRPHPVEWKTRILERVPAGDEVVVDPALRPGERRVIQEAIDGLLVERTRTVYWPTGPKTTSLQLRYPRTPRIVARGGAGRPPRRFQPDSRLAHLAPEVWTQ